MGTQREGGFCTEVKRAMQSRADRVSRETQLNAGGSCPILPPDMPTGGAATNSGCCLNPQASSQAQKSLSRCWQSQHNQVLSHNSGDQPTCKLDIGPLLFEWKQRCNVAQFYTSLYVTSQGGISAWVFYSFILVFLFTGGKNFRKYVHL